ncbi:MAG: T9SS type A sorting domain-containing protein [Flavobacteriales bacterium]|nr:T9SS type A sorting domain-containing protein [Flavobacteriales bacterium]
MIIRYFTMICFGMLAAVVSTAQVPDRMETNCDGETRSLHATLDAGLPVIVASKGFDCSICVNQAETVGDFADAYQGQIEVWGAMTYTYSSTEPTCDVTENWVSNYGWNNIFAFPDVEEYWLELGTPRYYVIAPETREVVYEGSNFSTATENATALLSLSTSELLNSPGDLKIYANNEGLQVHLNVPISGQVRMEVSDILGGQVHAFSKNLVKGDNRFTEPFNQNQGIYILRISADGKSTAKKFILQD